MITKAQHVLIIGSVWIEPASSAAGSRTLQLIEVFLAEGWKISFATAAGESSYKTDLKSKGIEAFNIVLNDASFDELVKELNPTIVIFDRFITEEQFGWRIAEICPTAVRITDTIDLHCLRSARHKALKEIRDFTANDLFNEIAKREIATIYRSDLSLVISETEIDLLQKYFKVDASLLHYIPFIHDGISQDDLTHWPSFKERLHFASIGNFLHEPNWDSVLFLKQSIWPIIRKKLPDAEIHVYGAYPSQKVFQLHQPKEGFLIKGRAENVGEVMLKARICLAPLRFGAGIKGKLFDAMLYGTPSITTAIGAESMHGDLPWNGAIASNAEDLASAAIDLYNDEKKWTEAQGNGSNIINSYFSKKLHAQKLIDKILTVQNDLQQHRLNNFTGAMLTHHSVSATKYMALWIETKNKLPGLKK